MANQPQDAFECFVKASNINQDSGDVWFNMGVLYEQCKQKQEACLAYQRSYSLNTLNNFALDRKLKLQSEDDYENVPKFIHSCFEISEIPFSAKKNDKLTKNTKTLPDITKFDAEIKLEIDQSQVSGKSDLNENFINFNKSPTAPEIIIKPELNLNNNVSKPQKSGFSMLPSNIIPVIKTETANQSPTISLQFNNSSQEIPQITQNFTKIHPFNPQVQPPTQPVQSSQQKAQYSQYSQYQLAAMQNIMMNPMLAAQMIYAMNSMNMMQNMKYISQPRPKNEPENLKPSQEEELAKALANLTEPEDSKQQKRKSSSDDIPSKKRKR